MPINHATCRHALSLGMATLEKEVAMCTNGVNTDQFKANLSQIDEAVALSRRWLHRAFHQAESAQHQRTAAKLREAQALLDEARAALEEAGDIVEREASNANVTVHLV
ncbi:MAG: dynein gamma chain protein [Actinomycetia bacterium]|nr:dynein gamma chain protein [Actinomycetes bacterium]